MVEVAVIETASKLVTTLLSSTSDKATYTEGFPKWQQSFLAAQIAAFHSKNRHMRSLVERLRPIQLTGSALDRALPRSAIPIVPITELI